MVPKEGNLSLSSYAKDLRKCRYTAYIYTVPSSTGLLFYNPLQFDTSYNLKIKTKKDLQMCSGF